MPKYKHKFAGRKSFALFVEWFGYAIRSIDENVDNILQLRLLRYILGEYYHKSIMPKIMSPPDKFQLVFNDAQAVAVALALNNHMDENLADHEKIMLNAVLTGIMQHLQQKILPINFPPIFQKS